MILAEAIAIGLVLGFFFYEITGLVAGGLVVPGYFALYWGQPVMMVISVLVALITWGCIKLAAQVTVLYGRRRFTVAILTGFACQWVIEWVLSGIDMANTRIDAIGYIIPGLLANEMDRQGISRTVLGLVTVSAGVRICLALLGDLGPW